MPPTGPSCGPEQAPLGQPRAPPARAFLAGTGRSRARPRTICDFLCFYLTWWFLFCQKVLTCRSQVRTSEGYLYQILFKSPGLVSSQLPMAVLSPCPVLCAGQLGVPPVRPREDPGVEFPSGALCGGAGSSLQLLGVGESQLCPSPPSWGCVWILVLTLTSFSASAMLPSSSYSIRHSISMPAMR